VVATLPCIGAFKGLQLLVKGLGACVACGGQCVVDGVVNCGNCTSETASSLGTGCMSCVDSIPNIVRCLIAGDDEGRPVCLTPPEGLRFFGCIGCCLPNPPPGMRAGGCKLCGGLTLFTCCGGSQPPGPAVASGMRDRGGGAWDRGGGVVSSRLSVGAQQGAVVALASKRRADGKRRAPLGAPSAASPPSHDALHQRSPSQGSSGSGGMGASGMRGGHMRSPSQGSSSGGRGHGYTPPKASPPAVAPQQPPRAAGRGGARPRQVNSDWDAPRGRGGAMSRRGASSESPF